MKTARILLGTLLAFVLALIPGSAYAAGLLEDITINMSSAAPSTSSTHTYSLTVGSDSTTMRTVTLSYCKEASGACTAPTGLSLASATLGTMGGASDGNWNLSTADNVATLTHTDVASSTDAWSDGDVIIFDIQSITNPTVAGCSGSGGTSGTCYIQIATKNLTGTTIDDGVGSISVITEVTVTARVDPTFTFVVAGVNSSTVNNGITTSVSSAYNTLPFGNLTAGTPKYAAHKLNVTTNNNGGYFIKMKMTTQMTGKYSGNNIDPFAYNSVSWSSPAAWTNPGATTPNTNTAWIGANTTDTDISGWSLSPSGKFGPVPTGSDNYVVVMQDANQDDGSTAIYVTYAIQANTYQPTDLYTGTLMYNALPTY
ncbi:hypothetical protein GYA49_01485 [Candidatus Beckwithbacteria bacterium]|nr:hypothetical protein [Candidatus Beckwithbacteria bacterium]